MALTESEELEMLELEAQEDSGETDEQQPSGPPPAMMDVLPRMIPEAYRMTPMGASSTDIVENPEHQLPLAGMAVGSMFGPAGMAAGAGLGQIGSRMVDIYKGDTSRSPGMESFGPMAQATVAGFPEVGGVKTAIQGAAQGLARRGLGIKGAMLKRMGLEKAEEVGQTMLEKGVIKATSPGTGATLERAQDLAETSGKAIGEGLSSLDEVGVKSIDSRKVARQVYDQLKPGRVGGAYNNEELVAREIRDTIMAHAKDGQTFASAQELKETLQELGSFHNMSDRLRAKMYRKASGIVRQALDESVGAAAGKQVVIEGGPSISGTDLLPRGEKVVGEVSTIAPDVLEKYKESKRIYGAAESAIEGLKGRLTSEASNATVSLRGSIIAMGAASQGHITPALEALGAWEIGSRYGARTGAATLNFLNSNAIAENVRRAVAAEFISRFRMKGDNQ